MQDAKVMTAILAGAAGMAAAVVVAGAIILAPQPALANPGIAAKTGFPCTKCHTAPPTLNAYGKNYKKSMKK
jgi:hypothetical protein